MSEMIEHVAKAIYGSRPRNKPWEILGQHKGIYLKAARAAIEAMMEPTEAMLKAGDIPGWDDSVTVDLAGEIWQAMLSEALSPPSEQEEGN